jgi:cobalt-zinc-cadmium efflux system outer membrane protein
MSLSRSTAFVAVAIGAFTAPADARTLTLEEALATARERAPALIAARMRVDEASARARAGGVLFTHNPVFAGSIGDRETPGEDDSTDLEFEVTQSFSMGGGRGARIAAGKADVAQASAEADMGMSFLLRDVEASFHRAVYENERVLLAASAESLAVDLVRIAERRFASGDVARLEVNVAKTALARARAEHNAAASARDESVADLRRLLGLAATDSVQVSGDLRAPTELALSDMLVLAAQRPDVRVLQAEIARADAETRMGGAQRWPRLDVGAGWKREQESEITSALVGLTLPLFDRGQLLRDESRARSRRLHGELTALQRALVVEVETAFSVYRKSVAAARALEDAMPLVHENENLVRRGYETGQLGLGELLLLRREIIEAREVYMARLLDAALAGVELRRSAGVLE